MEKLASRIGNQHSRDKAKRPRVGKCANSGAPAPAKSDARARARLNEKSVEWVKRLLFHLSRKNGGEGGALSHPAAKSEANARAEHHSKSNSKVWLTGC
jgi:hypothetical protein